MSKRCAKCEKTVYPLEELKCLDKVWHKGCFRCWECSMALNMKNYKGYDKKPYCSAHYPTTKFTAVAETPEMQRLAQNTKMQSQIKYHEDFEKNIKGTKIQVSDDPETQRLKAASANISQVEYRGLRERAQEMEQYRQNIPQNQEGGAPRREPGRIADYDPSRVGGVRMTPQEPKASPMSSKNQGHSVVYSSQGKVEQPQMVKVGSIHDYDPLNDNRGSLSGGYAPSSTMHGSAQWEETTPAPQNHAPQQHYPPPQHGMGQERSAPPSSQMLPPSQPMQPPPQQPAPVSSGPVYQAMYDYDAQDEDEIGFRENDLIVDCQPIDEGWMFGTVKRTGKRGMLPANYVERIK